MEKCNSVWRYLKVEWRYLKVEWEYRGRKYMHDDAASRKSDKTMPLDVVDGAPLSTQTVCKKWGGIAKRGEAPKKISQGSRSYYDIGPPTTLTPWRLREIGKKYLKIDFSDFFRQIFGLWFFTQLCAQKKIYTDSLCKFHTFECVKFTQASGKVSGKADTTPGGTASLTALHSDDDGWWTRMWICWQ